MYPYASLNEPHYPAPPKPKRRRESHGDPYAAALGNATLLGIGYLLLGRKRTAAMALVITAWFVAVVAASPEVLFWRIALAAWWVATVLHTFLLVRPERRFAPEAPLVDFHGPEPKRRDRGFAGAAVVLIAMALIGTRFDGTQVMEAADAAHRDGDCAGATAATANLDVTHRVADGALAAEARESGDACELLLAALDRTDPLESAEAIQSYMDHPAALWDGAGPERAERLLRFALDPLTGASTAPVRSAFDTMEEVLDASPRQSAAVRGITEDFLADFGEHQEEGCESREVNEWLFAQEWRHPELAEPVAAASGLIPLPILECARERYESDALGPAQDLYEEFLTAYPDHELAAEAAQELEAVETAIEREHVTELLSGDGYCDAPAPYREAAPYSGSGTNPMWLFGLEPEAYDLPGSWTTTDLDETVLVVCVEGPARGGFIESCEYEDFDTGEYIGTVRFYANAFTVEAYELKTGEPVDDYTVEIGGACPYILTFYGGFESERNASYAPEDLRKLFERLQ